jgi:hypothetical protein
MVTDSIQDEHIEVKAGAALIDVAREHAGEYEWPVKSQCAILLPARL